MLGRLEHVDAREHRLAKGIKGDVCRAAFALVLVAGGLVGWVPPVAAAAPVTITTAAEASASGFFAAATLAGGDDPTGTVTFRLFGPGDHTCARSPLFTSTNPVTGAGLSRQATSDSFAPPAGVYHFVATYSGDARNAPAGPTACGDPNATVGYGASSFAFAAQASQPAVVGGAMSDTATITASFGLSGTMSFALFGPGATDCTGTPVFTSTRPVQGNGSYTSAPFVPATPGVYRWVARYSGPDNPNAETACDDPAQRVEVKAPEVRAPEASGTSETCILPPGARSVIENRMAALRQALQALGDHPLAAILGRAGGRVERAVTACPGARPPG